MDYSTSMQELRNAIEILCGISDNMNCGTGAAHLVRTYLGSTNQTLAEGWQKAHNLCYDLAEKTSNIIKTIRYDVEAYIDAVESGELALINAVNKANEIAEQILNELELSK